MSFAYPWIVLFWFPLAALFWLSWRRGITGGVPYSNVAPLLGMESHWFEHLRRLPSYLRLIAILFFFLALARPQVVEHQLKRSGEGLDILMTVDTSQSMREAISYQGQWVTRLAAAKAVVKDFVEKRVDDRVGLVVFGEDAFTQAPLTLDHEVLGQFIENIYLGMAGRGTAIGRAILTSVKRMKDLKAKEKVVVLLTDGAQTVGSVRPEAAAEAARDLGVKVYTVGIGSRRTGLDSETLKKISELTGGQYFQAESVERLVSVYETIDRLEKSEVEYKDFSRRHEKAAIFLTIGLSLLLIELLFNLSRWRVVA